MSNEQHEEVVHVYDGIEELDNNLPRWWVILFYLSMMFAPLYLLYYHGVKAGPLPAERYAMEVDAATDSSEEATAEAGGGGPAPELEPSTDPAVLAAGKTVYMTFCMACHTADGGGMVGPDLCDDYWINGASYADSVKTIQDGVPNTGMISWKTTIKPDDITAVASYIWTLRGTTPANPKGPEGVKLDAEGNVVDEKPRQLLAPGA